MIYSRVAVFTALMAMVFGAPITSNSTNGVIQVPLTKKQYGKSTNLTRRSTPEEALDFTGIRYFADYLIGGQKQTAILDTGSSDTWTFSNQAWSGGYNPEASSSYTWENDDFLAAYGSGNDVVTGTWGEDTVTVGGANVPNYPFAYANQSSNLFPDNRGILGIGPRQAETANPKYPTYAERLKDAGVIQSNSFSIFSDASDTEATLLIGGIDTAKFKSPLYTLPFDTTEKFGSAYYSVNFEFQGVTYTGGILDTGTPNVLLPENVAQSLADQYGATYDPLAAAYIATSPPAQDLPGLDFEIGGIKVTIPGSDLFAPDGGDAWLFAINNNIVEKDYALNILGDPILRQLYLFFDIDNNEIAFAPVVHTSSSNLVAVGETVPESTPAPNQTEGGPSEGYGNNPPSESNGPGDGPGNQCVIC